MSLAYHLVKAYNASNFFTEFSYFTQPDPTHGNVYFVDHNTAVASGLSYVNNAGNVVMKVDDSSFVPDGQQRNSVRLSSNDNFGLGTLWVLDAYHMPYGCSVWGAYWSIGVGVGWPNGGEIDIFEGVNMQNSNQMTLHTGSGCTLPQGISQTGTPLTTNCGPSSDNSGCGTKEANTNSYGKPFADSGGGVWVTQFDMSGVRIWFVPRSAVPPGGVPPDPSKLGTPSAFIPPSGCDPATFFTNQQLIFDITLCGDWAGNSMGGACPVQSGQSCYSTYVVGDGHNFNQAYFEIASLKVYAAGAPTPSCLSTYTSLAGDTCDKLDKKYNLVSGTIKQANQFLDCSNIWTSTPICVPDGPYNPPSCKATYKSVAGDTCSSIDAKYSLVDGTIKTANSFLNCTDIWIGTSICVPDGPYKPVTCKTTYTSLAGDTCTSIDTKYNLVDGTTKTANSFLTCTDIWTNTPVCIPDGPYKPVTCKTTYKSIAGDTCATIDNEFNLIDGTTKSANSFLTCTDIWTGTPICIPDGPYKSSHEPNCATQTYKSLAGETCSSIETKFALAAGSISRANTFVNCADIWTGTNLSICVPTLSNGDPQTCTKTISSVAGDTCSSIGQTYGTSAAWIKAWNSFLNCADIWEHTSVCVSHT